MPNSQNTNGYEVAELNPAAPLMAQPASAEPDAASSNDDSSQMYGVLKCSFFTPKRGDIWGAFCFLFNGSTGEAMEDVFWVTRDLTGPPININMGWRELNRQIPQMGIYEKSIGEKLSASMLEIFSPSVRMDLCQTDESTRQLNAISAEIRNNFERLTHYFLEIKILFERLPRQELVKAGVLEGGEAEEKSAASADPGSEKSFEGTLITCQPVVDPIRGKPVSELKPGDMVEVKMQGGVGAGELIQQYLSSTDQDAIFPVESIEKKGDDKTYVFLTINDEIRGLITVTKDLRLHVLEPEKRKKTITVDPDSLIFGFVLFMALVIIVWVVKYLFF
jgi:hypothetical protein